MTEKELKAAGRKLDALRLRIEQLGGEEKILHAQVAKAMEVNRLDELFIRPDRKLVRETPVSREVNVDNFAAFAAGLPTEQMEDALRCIERKVSVTDAKRFAGDRLDELCTTKPGKPRVRVVGARGGQRSTKAEN